MDMRVADFLPCKPLLTHSSLPLLVQAALPDLVLRRCLPALHQVVDEELPRAGALLFRGFRSLGAAHERAAHERAAHERESDLPALVRSFGHSPFQRPPSSPATSNSQFRQTFALQNAEAHALRWPAKLWFHCRQLGSATEEMSLADNREVYRQLDFSLRKRFAEKRLMYVRNYGNGFDLPWQRVFQTESRAVVEAFCRAHQIFYEWKPDGQLRTRHVSQAVACHPETGDIVWFNQAHLWHVSNLPYDQQLHLCEMLDSTIDLPRNVYYADGSPLEADALQQIRAVLEACKVSFPWQKGDFLMLDNMLVAHGRLPCNGRQKMLLTMAETTSDAPH